MKKSVLLGMFVVAFLLLMVFPQSEVHARPSAKAQVDKQTVEVYYFHRNRRCGPCRTIENLTKKTMETYFTSEMESGEVAFFIVNVEQEDGRPIAQKFNVMSTALFLNCINGEEEKATNLTSLAYRHVRNEEAFLSNLKQMIEEELGR